MSDMGPGWWLASDGRWYPPEQHPDAASAASASAAPGLDQPAADQPAVDQPSAPPGVAAGGATGPFQFAPVDLPGFAPSPPGAPASIGLPPSVPPAGGPHAVLPGDQPFTFGAPTGRGPSRTTRRRLVGAGAGALALVVALITGLVVESGGQSALAAVISSVSSSTASKTADVHISINEAVAGQGTVNVTGDGAVDFSDDAAQLSLTTSGTAGADVQLSEIMVDGVLYESLPQISQVLPGKQWISTSIGTSQSTSTYSSNPTDVLSLLASEGNTVTPLGPSSIGGEAVTGYKVVLDPAYIKSHLGSSGVNPAERQAIASMLGSTGLVVTVYIDDSTRLLRQIDESLQMGFGGTSVSATVEEDLTNYGTPVSITAPPADQVATLQQFLQAESATLFGQSSTG